MSAGSLTDKGDRIIHLLALCSSRLGAGVLVAMMLLITSDVVLRFIFNKPVPGTFELVEVMMGAVVSLSIAYCGVRRGHVAVELLTEKLPAKTRNLLDMLHHMACIIFFAAIAYKSAEQAVVINESGTVTALLEIPVYPFIWVLSFGSALLAMVYFWQMMEIFRKGAPE